MSVNETTKAKFHPGQIVATPGALEALQNAGQTPHEILVRHLSGDWGDLDAEDRSLNDAAVIDVSRILSAYTTRKGSACGSSRRRLTTTADEPRVVFCCLRSIEPATPFHPVSNRHHRDQREINIPVS